VLVDPDVVDPREDNAHQRFGQQPEPDHRGDVELDDRGGSSHERTQHPVLDLDQEVLLGLDVVVQGTAAESDRVPELGDSRCGVPLLGEQGCRPVDDLLKTILEAGAWSRGPDHQTRSSTERESASSTRSTRYPWPP